MYVYSVIFISISIKSICISVYKILCRNRDHLHKERILAAHLIK